MSTSPRVVLITGCSQGGIGSSLSQEYAQRGCIVYATARKLEAMVGLDQPNIHKLVLDVTNEAQIQKVVSFVVETEGRIDILVNNAGMMCPGPLLDVTLEEARRVFETNMFSILALSRAVIPHMARRSKGVVVNVSSVMGEIPTPWMGMYAATKAAVHSISESLWMECKAFNVDVMLIVPGKVKSNIAANGQAIYNMPDNGLYHKYLKNVLDRITASQVGGSMPTEEFSTTVAAASLSTSPPRYMTMGGSSTIFQILLWLPRTWVLRLFWRQWTAVAKS